MVVVIFDIGDKTCYIDKNILEYIREKYGDYCWQCNKHGYLIFHYKHYKQYRVHQLVFEANGEIIPEDKEIDYIDMNKYNNTKDNLRLVNRNINCYNRNKLRKNSSSKYLGVSFDKWCNKYASIIGINYKTIKLGRFSNEIEAAYAYDVAKKLITDLDKMTYNNVEDQLDEKTREEIKEKIHERIKNFLHY